MAHLVKNRQSWLSAHHTTSDHDLHLVNQTVLWDINLNCLSVTRHIPQSPVSSLLDLSCGHTVRVSHV